MDTTERDLTRYRALLREGYAELALLGLTAEEAAVLVALFADGVPAGAGVSPVGAVCAALTDADNESASGPGTARLRLLLRTLSAVGAWALVDAIERFWREPERDGLELLAEIGLVSAETAAS